MYIKKSIITCLSFLSISIASFAANSEALAVASQGKILIVVSSEDSLRLKGNKKFPTGYYLNELMVPARRLAEAGYELVVANPKGSKPAMDVRSDDLSYFGGNKEQYSAAQEFQKKFTALERPLKLSEVAKGNLEDYRAIFIPGGHAPMVDLMSDRDLGKILKHFHSRSKPTALICHGPVALASANLDAKAYRAALVSGDGAKQNEASKNWIYAGYKMTVFSTKEEKIAEKSLGGETEFFPEDVLRKAGGDVIVGAEWQSNAIRDRELITGQNPFSDGKFIELLLAALAEKQK